MRDRADGVAADARPGRLLDRRLDGVDGLRALAVLAVMAFHFGVPGFQAGFLGVDAFFVLSGFLITTLLLEDVRRHGKVRLSTFWSRRVRRLAPALLLLILVVIVWGATQAPPPQRDSLRGDVFASLAYVANWHFIGTSSYFANDGTESPLQHIWSLAVEEQFYVLWPLLIGGLAWWLARRRAASTASTGHGRTDTFGLTTLSVAAVAVVGSLVSVVLLALLFDPDHPERAYMGTDTRAFEPLVGAALAALLVSPKVRAWAHRHSVPLAVGGLTVLVAGILLLGDGQGALPAYYRGGSAVVALGCGALVVGVALGGGHLGRALAIAPLAYLGRLSYSAYLWHWPLKVWLPAGVAGPARVVVLTAGTFALAALSYHLVETPVRQGRLTPLLSARRLVFVLPLVLTACAASAATLVQPPPATPAGAKGPYTVLMVGDSVPSRLMPALTAEAKKRGWIVYSAARGSCPAVAVDPLKPDGSRMVESDCHDGVRALQDKDIARYRPDLVIWWSRYEVADRAGPNGRFLAAGTPGFWQAQQADLKDRVAALHRDGAAVVAVRIDRSGQGMYTRSNCNRQQCLDFLQRLLDYRLPAAWNRILDQQAGRLPGFAAIGMDDVYCKDKATVCNDRLPDGSFARPDGTHFSPQSAPKVAAVLLDRARAAAQAAERPAAAVSTG